MLQFATDDDQKFAEAINRLESNAFACEARFSLFN